MNNEIIHLQTLEAESIHVIRELVAESERPVLLFSGGKDSAVCLRLAGKAFWPAPLPFAVMHVDTGHNFTEVPTLRDRTIEELDAELIAASVQQAIDEGRVVETSGALASRNRLQTEPQLFEIERHRFDSVFGGARRDEEKARAKERVFSFRDELGQWDPKNQRPELWSLHNARHRAGEHNRGFPISNWTEMDIWQYVLTAGIELPSIYFSHRRRVLERDGLLMAEGPFRQRKDNEELFEGTVRSRTVGDMPCIGAFASTASAVEEIITEVLTTRITEQGASRADDLTAEAAMEGRKREGCF